ncbi:hypothetical protein RN001_002599 [Aquatica leii]|uniref:Mitochondrial ribonuclease P catalytic subunit n=1 Tax=Aquatica leii TaxID=1421715 RepID=A0AAN7PHF3_9COLE|nr:hypothetical protein RN001_002599 [Aquatica leii]
MRCSQSLYTLVKLHTFHNFKCLQSYISTFRNVPNRKVKIEQEQKNVLGNVIPSILLNKKIQTVNDWSHVREEILNTNVQITSKSIDSAILSVCMASKKYQLGIEYVEYLKHQKIALGLATLGKYFKLLYLKNYPKNLSEPEEADIYNLYEELRKVYKVFDVFTCENLIHILSLTNYWRECFRLLDEMKISCQPGNVAYSVIIAACFRNNDADLGWSYLNECAEKDRFPSTIAYTSYIDLHEQTQNLETLEKLFKYFQSYDIKCDIEMTNKMINVYKKMKLKAEVITVKNSVKCRNCHNQLQKLELKDEEFDDLKKAIFKNVIIGSNVFYKTTPKEVDEFKWFVANMKKYDVIIDGLNVAYSVGTKHPSHVFAFLVKSAVQHFVLQNKTVLLLGRTHMQKWSKPNWSYVSKNADIFLTQTLSHDDPYLLYCALNSGKNTIIVSRDLMRNHVFKLNDIKLKILFSRWLLQCQYQLLHINDSGKVFFKYPLPYSRTAQKIGNIWHLPCDDSSNNSDLHKWLCLSK